MISSSHIYQAPEINILKKTKSYWVNKSHYQVIQVTVEPDIMLYDMQKLDSPEFLVIACDGVWDCFKNGQLVKLIRDKLSLGWRLNKIVEYILNDSLTMANNYTGIGFDNMTLIIVAIHKKKARPWMIGMNQ